MTEHAEDSIPKFFDSVGINGLDSLLEEAPKEVQGTDVEEDRSALERGL